MRTYVVSSVRGNLQLRKHVILLRRTKNLRMALKQVNILDVIVWRSIRYAILCSWFSSRGGF